MATYGQFVTYGPFTTAIGGGWKLYHYVAGTSTLKNVWTDRGKTTTAAQPVVADANGVMSFYADGLYRFVVYDANNVQLYEWDNVFFGSLESTNHAEGVALASASTLVLGSDGDYFHVTGTTTIAAITGTQPFVFLTFDSALTLTHSSSLVLKGGVDKATSAGETVVFVNDGSNVFRELDNNVPTKYAVNTFTAAQTFGGAVTCNASVTCNSTAFAQTPAQPTQVAIKSYVDKRVADGTALVNGALSASVSSNALTVSLLTMNGTAPSSDDTISIAFRPTSLTSSTPNVRTVTSATSVTVSAGSTLGFTASQISRLYVLALDNSGVVELGLYHPLSGTNHLPIDETLTYTSTAEGGAGGADSAHTIYSTTARTGVAVSVLGYIDIQTGGTAGNWSNAPIQVQVLTPSTPRSGHIIQRQVSSSTATAGGTTAMPFDDTIPQNTEGTQFLTCSITPKHAADLLWITHAGTYSTGGAADVTIALFQDSTANALAAVGTYRGAGDQMGTNALVYVTQAGTTSSTTFKIRAGAHGGQNVQLNGKGVGSTRVYGGVAYSALVVTEMFT